MITSILIISMLYIGFYIIKRGYSPIVATIASIPFVFGVVFVSGLNDNYECVNRERVCAEESRRTFGWFSICTIVRTIETKKDCFSWMKGE